MASSAQPVKQAQKVRRSRLDMVENQFADLSIASSSDPVTPAVYAKMEHRGKLHIQQSLAHIASASSEFEEMAW